MPQKLSLLFSTILFLVISACSGQDRAAAQEPTGVPSTAKSLVVAGGCFWCVESDFEKLPGIYEAVSGYSGGDNPNATYRSHKGHREVVEIFYDPEVTSYDALVRYFLTTIDVTDAGGQFCDRGYAYTTAIQYRNDAEKAAAVKALSWATETLNTTVETQLDAFKFVVTAEGYHQDYYKKNPLRYKLYRGNCGRDKTVKRVWGDAAYGGRK